MGKLELYIGPAVLTLLSVSVIWLAYIFQKYLRIVVNLFLGVQIKTVPENEVQAEGERSQLDKLIDCLRSGPPGARVEKVETSWSEYTGSYADFGIKY